MPQKKKYQILIAAALVLCVYLASTEIIDRWAEVFRLHAIFIQKEETLLDPQVLAEKKMDLLARKRLLGSMLTKGTARYEQSETGVFEYLNASAKQSGIRFQSLTPLESQTSGQIREVGFKLQFSASYHHLGAFLNAVESRAVLSQVK